jgi:hypothetical protein
MGVAAGAFNALLYSIQWNSESKSSRKPVPENPFLGCAGFHHVP